MRTNVLKCTKTEYKSFPQSKRNLIKLFVTFNRTPGQLFIKKKKKNPTAAKQLDKPQNSLNATSMQFI